jgi:hypothetical protein
MWSKEKIWKKNKIRLTDSSAKFTEQFKHYINQTKNRQSAVPSETVRVRERERDHENHKVF